MEAFDFSKTNDFIEYAHDFGNDCMNGVNESVSDEDEGKEFRETGEISIQSSESEKDGPAQEFEQMQGSEEVDTHNESNEVDVDGNEDQKGHTHNISQGGTAQSFGDIAQVDGVGRSGSSPRAPCVPNSSSTAPAPVSSSPAPSSSLSASRTTTAPRCPSAFASFGAPPAGSRGGLPVPAGSPFSDAVPAAPWPCQGTRTGGPPSHPPQVLPRWPARGSYSDGGAMAAEGPGPTRAAQPAEGHTPYGRTGAPAKGALDTPFLRFAVFLRGNTVDQSGQPLRTRESEILERDKVLRRFEQVLPVDR